MPLTALSSQADRIQNDMDHVSAMITEIHKWFVDNLRSATAVGLNPTISMPVTSQATPFETLRFELYEHSGQDSQLICPQTSLNQKVTRVYSGTTLRNSQMFNCNCSLSTGDLGNHRPAVEAYRCELLA